MERVWKRKSASAQGELFSLASAHEDDYRLRTWRRLIMDVAIERILPRDVSFGPGIKRNGDGVERLAFFGDKYLNLSVALALENQLAENGETMSVREISALCSSAQSNIAQHHPDPKWGCRGGGVGSHRSLGWRWVFQSSNPSTLDVPEDVHTCLSTDKHVLKIGQK